MESNEERDQLLHRLNTLRYDTAVLILNKPEGYKEQIALNHKQKFAIETQLSEIKRQKKKNSKEKQVGEEKRKGNKSQQKRKIDPVYVDDYTGVRCEYCGGKVDDKGRCANDSSTWPHPNTNVVLSNVQQTVSTESIQI